jgi:hypothetical protein
MTTQELIFRVALVGFGAAVIIALLVADARSGEYETTPAVQIAAVITAVLLLVASFWGVSPT